MTIFKFKAKAVRTINSPSNENITTYYTWVNFRDLPKEFSLEVNPRKPKMNTAVAKQLIEAVKGPDDSNFDINNRGIVITAKSFKFDTNTHSITLDFGDDPNRYGILDGGHTYTAIVQNVHQLSPKIDRYVKMEIIVGDEVDVSALADARNTSAQVSDVALFELDDKFEFIKDSIKDETYAHHVAYKDNDDKDIRIAELLKLMFAFNIKRYPDDGSAPVSAYSGKAAVFRDYKKEYDKKDNIYKYLSPLLPSFVELYETIQKELPEKYIAFKHEEGKNANFGKVRGIEGKGVFKTDFTNESISYQISVGYLLPIFGAFRALLKRNNETGEINWEFDPIHVWKKAGIRLVQNTFDTDTNPQQIGKSKTLWQANYRIVDSFRKDLLLEKLMKN
ncbi:AIPR family protein [Staphylococcus agnetis]|uniref:AIPR family protein n=1 Tax=Staphylococcus agnetis TaxID=985762 RepID=UPI0004E3E819|nr:AIPR family protein [Staphylococcus agnetis]KFE42136.1 abortive phage infection protein [Staphylococcus agnetis]NJH65751.1 abortive phage infection protein [Staphylococcus agnetis]NJH97067.1 abortive phage infection protein [Staphylococcus agnetis]PTH47637.1 abortive phage infection protein [Staphylococcus agnetis]PTH74484.1 abortive phage infection protein [Staphylococcus agnetis]